MYGVFREPSKWISTRTPLKSLRFITRNAVEMGVTSPTTSLRNSVPVTNAMSRMSQRKSGSTVKIQEEQSIENILEVGSISSSSSDSGLEILESRSINIEEENEKKKLFRQGLYSPGSGEICAKYIAVSDSDVYNHVYYGYPAVKDPGIEEALLLPEKEIIYDDDGQELYLHMCKEMKQAPIRIFYKGLLTDKIDLRYYGINPTGVIAMAAALSFNPHVKTLDLTSNFLNNVDACYHIGQIFGYNNVIQRLILKQCNIRQHGIRSLVVYFHTRNFNLLDLSENNLYDEGLAHLVKEIDKGAVIRRLILRRNYLTSAGLKCLAESIEYHDHVHHLDLSWNNFVKSYGPSTLFRVLGRSEAITELDMSWTSLKLARELAPLFRIPTLKKLNLSNNSLTSGSARVIARNLHRPQDLQVLDLSFNPFTPSDACLLLSKMKLVEVTLKELRLDNITVSKEFIVDLKEIQSLDFRRNTIITHGFVLHNYTLPEKDIKIIVMKRLVRATARKAKSALDVLMYLLEQNLTLKYLELAEFNRTMMANKISLKEEFLEQMYRSFPGIKTEKGNKTVNLDVIVDYIHRLWPDKKLPPTPPLSPPLTPTPRHSKNKSHKSKKIVNKK